jgi:hypothetical protein
VPVRVPVLQPYDVIVSVEVPVYYDVEVIYQPSTLILCHEDELGSKCVLAL